MAYTWPCQPNQVHSFGCCGAVTLLPGACKWRPGSYTTWPDHLSNGLMEATTWRHILQANRQMAVQHSWSQSHKLGHAAETCTPFWLSALESKAYWEGSATWMGCPTWAYSYLTCALWHQSWSGSWPSPLHSNPWFRSNSHSPLYIIAVHGMCTADHMVCRFVSLELLSAHWNCADCGTKAELTRLPRIILNRARLQIWRRLYRTHIKRRQVRERHRGSPKMECLIVLRVRSCRKSRR